MNPVEKIKEALEGTSFKYKGKSYLFKECKSVNSKLMVLTDTATLQADYDNPEAFLNEIEVIKVDVSGEQLPVPDNRVDASIVEVNRAIKAEIINSNQRSTRMADKMEEMFNKLCDGTPDDNLIKQATAMRDMSNSIVNLETLKFKMLNNL